MEKCCNLFNFFYTAWRMDTHSTGVVAVLGIVGAATGALSAVFVYAICVRRSKFPMFTPGGGPLNW